MLKIAIYGVGAVGSVLAARLALAGHNVSGIARGVTCATLKRDGLRFQYEGKTSVVRIRIEADPAELGIQDVVFLSVKSPALPAVAKQIAPLIGSDTVVITAMNGIPWWFFQTVPGPLQHAKMESLDPDGTLSRSIPSHHILGCVVLFASTCPEPGLVKLNFGNKIILGEPVGGASKRLSAIVSVLNSAGLDAQASLNIRTEIWRKLCGNMIMNPVSVITGATAEQILGDPLVHQFCTAATKEAAALGAELGFPIRDGEDERGALTLVSGAFKTSMLQDAEAGRPLEIDSLVSVVYEVSKKLEFPIPTIANLLGLVRLYGRAHGIYQGGASA